MSISGSVLRNRAVLLIYLRAVSNSYFTVGCFNSERAVQAQRPHPGCAGGWPPAKGFLSSRRWAEQPDYSKPAPRRRGATAVAFVLITRGAVVVMPHCGKSQLILGEKAPNLQTAGSVHKQRFSPDYLVLICIFWPLNAFHWSTCVCLIWTTIWEIGAARTALRFLLLMSVSAQLPGCCKGSPKENIWIFFPEADMETRCHEQHLYHVPQQAHAEPLAAHWLQKLLIIWKAHLWLQKNNFGWDFEKAGKGRPQELKTTVFHPVPQKQEHLNPMSSTKEGISSWN